MPADETFEDRFPALTGDRDELRDQGLDSRAPRGNDDPEGNRPMPESESFQDRLDDLIDQWEELRGGGLDPKPEELTDDPELRVALERAITDLRFMEAALSGAPVPEAPALGVPSRYESLTFHDQGGMGIVYRAFDAELKREVAYKVIKAHLATDRHAVAKFLGEARVTARLQHPGVVPVYGLSDDGDGRPSYAMRFVEGTSLLSAVEAFHATPRRKPTSRDDWLPLLGHFVRVCQTIQHAHGLGVLHRDLAPRNVLLLGDGETFVIDWGLASDANLGTTADDDRDRLAETRAGTAPFTAPEVFDPTEGQPFSPRSDVYSLGALLYLILTGRAPYSGTTTPEVVTQIRKGPPPDARSVVPGIPRPLARISAQAMSRSPLARYATPEKLARDVELWIAGGRVNADREPWHEMVLRLAGRHPTATTAGALSILLTIVVVSSVFLIRDSRARTNLEREVALTNKIATAMTRAASVLDSRNNPHPFAHPESIRSFLEIIESKEQNPQAVAEVARSLRKIMEDNLRERETAARFSLELAETQSRSAIEMTEAMLKEFPENEKRYRPQLGLLYTALAGLKLSEVFNPADVREYVRAVAQSPRRHPRQAEFEYALELLDKALGLLKDAEPDPGLIDFEIEQVLLANWNGRYLASLALARHTEALQALEQVILYTTGAKKDSFVGLRSPVRMAAEMEQSKMPWSKPPTVDHAKAIRLADFLAGYEGVSDAAVYNAACAFSLASLDETTSEAERRRRANQAMTYLQRIAAAGYFRPKGTGLLALLPGRDSLGELRRDTDLDPLRKRPDFQALVKEVSARAATTSKPSTPTSVPAKK